MKLTLCIDGEHDADGAETLFNDEGELRAKVFGRLTFFTSTKEKKHPGGGESHVEIN